MSPDSPSRSALLARLPAVGFVPPDDAAPWSFAARSAAFADEVEAFAAAYWTFPPGERRVRFNRLFNARYGSAAARLGLLHPGLDLTRDPAHGPGPTTYAELVRELEAVRHRVVATQYVELRSRTIASDDPMFASPPSGALPRYTGFERSVADKAGEALVRNRFRIAVAAAVLLALLTLWRGGVPDDRTRPPRTFTADEVKAFQTYHDGPRAGTLSRAPAGYDDWVRAGKPDRGTP